MKQSIYKAVGLLQFCLFLLLVPTQVKAAEDFTKQTVVIPINQAISTSANLNERKTFYNENLRLFGIIMPAAWTTANITFQASFDGGTTWVPIYDQYGAEIVAQAATSRYIILDPVVFSAIPMLKVRSGTTATPVVQAAAATLTLILRGI